MVWLSGKEVEGASPFRPPLSFWVWRPHPFFIFTLLAPRSRCGRQHGLLAEFEAEKGAGSPLCSGSDVIRKL